MRHGGRRQEEDLKEGAAAKSWDPEEFKTQRRIRYWKDGRPLSHEDTIDGFLFQWTPYSVPPAVWPHIRALTVDAAARTIQHRTEAQQIANAIARFVYWAYREGIDIAPSVFHPDIRDRYISLQTQLGPGAAGNARGLLTRAGRAVLGPPTYPPQAAFHKRPKLIEPFDDAEVSEIVGSLRGPRTEHMRDDHIVLVAVELGTGLQSGEFLALLGTDVSQDNDGVVVRVTTGPSQRTVPVLRRWETHVAAAAERVGDRPLFMPQRRRVQRYDVTTFIGNLPPSTAPHLTIRRLRATWIVNHMRVGTPLNVLADAAGITTDQIGRFARHLPALAPDHARALLRGVER